LKELGFTLGARKLLQQALHDAELKAEEEKNRKTLKESFKEDLSSDLYLKDVKIMENIGAGCFGNPTKSTTLNFSNSFQIHFLFFFFFYVFFFAGSVYRGMWGVTTVALKSLRSPALNEFEAEAKILRTLRHPK
jgi:hypothetical protein